MSYSRTLRPAQFASKRAVNPRSVVVAGLLALTALAPSAAQAANGDAGIDLSVVAKKASYQLVTSQGKQPAVGCVTGGVIKAGALCQFVAGFNVATPGQAKAQNAWMDDARAAGATAVLFSSDSAQSKVTSRWQIPATDDDPFTMKGNVRFHATGKTAGGKVTYASRKAFWALEESIASAPVPGAPSGSRR